MICNVLLYAKSHAKVEFTFITHDKIFIKTRLWINVQEQCRLPNIGHNLHLWRQVHLLLFVLRKLCASS